MTYHVIPVTLFEEIIRRDYPCFNSFFNDTLQFGIRLQITDMLMTFIKTQANEKFAKYF